MTATYVGEAGSHTGDSRRALVPHLTEPCVLGLRAVVARNEVWIRPVPRIHPPETRIRPV
jgi:hypothetical protein